MKTSLLSLYASVLVPVFSEWISKGDLGFLDTAVCSQEHRKKFLDLLTLCHVTYELSDDATYFDWMILRGLRLKKLVVSTWSPVVESLIQSPHLSSLEIDFHTLILHQEQISRLRIHVIVVNSPYSFDVSKLKIVGPVITELSIVGLSEYIDIKTIAAFSPNLKSVSVSRYSFILPLVDACQLDEINGCNLGSLVKRETCQSSYHCNLRRTSEVNDETAVCLGEGKYYHVTALWCGGKMTEEDVDLLIPLMTHLTFLSVVSGDFCSQLTSVVLQKCHKLTDLNVCNSMLLHELIHLLRQSPLLRRLDFETDDTIIADDCIAVMSKCCPLLEVCYLNGCMVESLSVMSELFSKCHYLTEFDATQWPFEALLSFAVNCESLALSSLLHVARKSGRGLRTLEMPNHLENKAFVHALLSQNPTLCYFWFDHYCGDLSFIIETMVLCCPLLTSFDLRHSSNAEGTSLLPLGRLLHLRTLKVNDVTGFTVDTLSAVLENKSTTLVSLTLAQCNITSDMVSVIARLCPALMCLDLKRNRDIQSSDVLKLLNSCINLEVLFVSPMEIQGRRYGMINKTQMTHLRDGTSS